MASPKIKHAKIMRIVNDSAARGRLSENSLTRKFIIRNICNAKYSRITVVCWDIYVLQNISIVGQRLPANHDTLSVLLQISISKLLPTGIV